ncbi:hypothetical protein Ahia01_000913800 [Argonauta hians]
MHHRLSLFALCTFVALLAPATRAHGVGGGGDGGGGGGGGEGGSENGGRNFAPQALLQQQQQQQQQQQPGCPVILEGIPDQQVTAGQLLVYTIAHSTAFRLDERSDYSIHLSAASENQQLPKWISFDESSRQLIAVPTMNDGFGLYIKVTVSEKSHRCENVTDIFYLEVKPFQLDLEPSSVKGKPGRKACFKGVYVIQTTLIFAVSLNALDAAARYSIMKDLADFLDINATSITISSNRELFSIEDKSKSYSILASGRGNTDLVLPNVTELTWRVPCSVFKEVNLFMQVLQHNVAGGRLTQEVNYDVVGWYISALVNPSRQYQSQPRKKRYAHKYATMMPTPHVKVFPATRAVESSAWPSESSSSFEHRFHHSSVPSERDWYPSKADFDHRQSQTPPIGRGSSSDSHSSRGFGEEFKSTRDFGKHFESSRHFREEDNFEPTRAYSVPTHSKSHFEGLESSKEQQHTGSQQTSSRMKHSHEETRRVYDPDNDRDYDGGRDRDRYTKTPDRDSERSSMYFPEDYGVSGSGEMSSDPPPPHSSSSSSPSTSPDFSEFTTEEPITPPEGFGGDFTNPSMIPFIVATPSLEPLFSGVYDKDEDLYYFGSGSGSGSGDEDFDGEDIDEGTVSTPYPSLQPSGSDRDVGLESSSATKTLYVDQTDPNTFYFEENGITIQNVPHSSAQYHENIAPSLSTAPSSARWKTGDVPFDLLTSVDVPEATRRSSWHGGSAQSSTDARHWPSMPVKPSRIGTSYVDPRIGSYSSIPYEPDRGSIGSGYSHIDPRVDSQSSSIQVRPSSPLESGHTYIQTRGPSYEESIETSQSSAHPQSRHRHPHKESSRDHSEIPHSPYSPVISSSSSSSSSNQPPSGPFEVPHSGSVDPYMSKPRHSVPASSVETQSEAYPSKDPSASASASQPYPSKDPSASMSQPLSSRDISASQPFPSRHPSVSVPLETLGRRKSEELSSRYKASKSVDESGPDPDDKTSFQHLPSASRSNTRIVQPSSTLHPSSHSRSHHSSHHPRKHPHKSDHDHSSMRTKHARKSSAHLPHSSGHHRHPHRRTKHLSDQVMPSPASSVPHKRVERSSSDIYPSRSRSDSVFSGPSQTEMFYRTYTDIRPSSSLHSEDYMTLMPSSADSHGYSSRDTGLYTLRRSIKSSEIHLPTSTKDLLGTSLLLASVLLKLSSSSSSSSSSSTSSHSIYSSPSHSSSLSSSSSSSSYYYPSLSSSLSSSSSSFGAFLGESVLAPSRSQSPYYESSRTVVGGGARSTTEKSDGFPWFTDRDDSDDRMTRPLPTWYTMDYTTTTTTTTATTPNRSRKPPKKKHRKPGQESGGKKPKHTNRAPDVINPIGKLYAFTGRPFEFQIPENTFNDLEDGSTRDLTLDIAFKWDSHKPPTTHFQTWLQFDESQQAFTGLPLPRDMKESPVEITINAIDQGGKIAQDIVLIYVNDSYTDTVPSHDFRMKFDVNGKRFLNDRRKLRNLMRKLSAYFGDDDSSFITILGARPGSLIITWTNNSIATDHCDNKTIQAVKREVLDHRGYMNPRFSKYMSPKYKVTDVEFQLKGACQDVSEPIEPEGVIDVDPWAEAIIPTVVAVAIAIFIVVIILLICSRKQSKEKSKQIKDPRHSLEDEDLAVYHREQALKDKSVRPKRAVILPGDGKPPKSGGGGRRGNSKHTPQIGHPYQTRTGYDDRCYPSEDYYYDDYHDDDNYDDGDNEGYGNENTTHTQPPPPYRLPPPYHMDNGSSYV